jgi:diacylglycerol kinase (ATP)
MIVIVANSHAGSAARLTELQQALVQRRDIVLHETKTAEEATSVAAEALRGGAEMIVAAGGDGTVNAVVNGLAADFAGATLGIIPLGTGNDLARTLAVPLEPLEALALLSSGVVRPIDVIHLGYANRVTYGVNMAVGGFTGQMNEMMTEDLKASWGPLAYLMGAVKTLPHLTGYQTDIQWDGITYEHETVLNIAVANGRTAGGGLPVAPIASPEDGWLDVVIVRYASAIGLADVAARLLIGTYLEAEPVSHHRVRHLYVHSRPGMWFNLDGELLTNDPVTFTVRPRALRVVVGPAYMPDVNAVSPYETLDLP